MTIPIPSSQQRFQISVGIKAFNPFELSVKGADRHKQNSYYIRRRIPIKPYLFEQGEVAYREFKIPFPISPQQLTVSLADLNYGDDEPFSLEKFEVQKLPPATLWTDEKMHRFIPFAEDFAQKAGYIPPGFHESPDGEFLISYLPKIISEDGTVSRTPARISRNSGRIQVSRKHFIGYTIPMRILILLHELSHDTLNTRDELEADRNALRVYLSLDYPKTEALYATTKIFNLHPAGKEHRDRVKQLVDFIDDYSLQLEEGRKTDDGRLEKRQMTDDG